MIRQEKNWWGFPSVSIPFSRRNVLWPGPLSWLELVLENWPEQHVLHRRWYGWAWHGWEVCEHRQHGVFSHVTCWFWELGSVFDSGFSSVTKPQPCYANWLQEWQSSLRHNLTEGIAPHRFAQFFLQRERKLVPRLVPSTFQLGSENGLNGLRWSEHCISE